MWGHVLGVGGWGCRRVSSCWLQGGSYPISGQIGYITLPSGGPQCFTTRDKIRSGPQVGRFATSPRSCHKKSVSSVPNILNLFSHTQHTPKKKHDLKKKRHTLDTHWSVRDALERKGFVVVVAESKCPTASEVQSICGQGRPLGCSDLKCWRDTDYKGKRAWFIDWAVKPVAVICLSKGGGGGGAIGVFGEPPSEKPHSFRITT